MVHVPNHSSDAVGAVEMSTPEAAHIWPVPYFSSQMTHKSLIGGSTDLVSIVSPCPWNATHLARRQRQQHGHRQKQQQHQAGQRSHRCEVALIEQDLHRLSAHRHHCLRGDVDGHQQPAFIVGNMQTTTLNQHNRSKIRC